MLRSSCFASNNAVLSLHCPARAFEAGANSPANLFASLFVRARWSSSSSCGFGFVGWWVSTNQPTSQPAQPASNHSQQPTAPRHSHRQQIHNIQTHKHTHTIKLKKHSSLYIPHFNLFNYSKCKSRTIIHFYFAGCPTLLQ